MEKEITILVELDEDEMNSLLDAISDIFKFKGIHGLALWDDCQMPPRLRYDFGARANVIGEEE